VIDKTPAEDKPANGSLGPQMLADLINKPIEEAPLPRRHSKQAFASAVYRMTLANVPAPAKKSTDPKKRTDSKVVRVQRVRMWITLAQAPPSETNIHGFLSIYDSKPFF